MHFIDGYNEVEEFKKALDEEQDPYLKEQLQMLYNPLYKGMIDPEQYFQNSDDIINEEELEESVDESRRQSPL